MTTPHEEVAAANRAYRDALDALNKIDPAAYTACTGASPIGAMGMAYLASQESGEYDDQMLITPGKGCVDVDMSTLIDPIVAGPIRSRWRFGITAGVNPQWQAIDLDDTYFEPPTWRTFRDAFGWAVDNTGPRR